MLTTTAQLTNADLAEAKGRGFIRRFSVEGFDVLALKIGYRQSMGYFQRVGSFVLFMVAATWLAMRLRGVDVVYASSTPLTVGIPALAARRWVGRPFVFEVRDPWPEIPIAMGIIRRPWMIRLLQRLQRTIYRRAAAIVTLSPGMEAMARAAAPKEKAIVNVPNSADTEFFRPDVDGADVRKSFGWGGRFVCVHTGAMGRVNGLDLIVRAAHHFRDDRNFHFVLIGEGKEKAGLKAQRDRLGLTNLEIIDGVAKDRMPAILAAADLCLMTVMPLAILEHNSANKFFDYLSAGRPVLLNYGGWQRRALEAAKAGLGCTLGDDQEFFNKLESLRSDPARCLDMPRQARKLAIEQFDRDQLAAKALGVILNVVPRPRHISPGS